MKYIENWIDGELRNTSKKNWLDKYNPHTGQIISKIANSDILDIQSVIESSEKSFFNLLGSNKFVEINLLRRKSSKK